MLGNDIVDCNVARSEGKHNNRRWLDKLFTLQEQAYISSSLNVFYMSWVLWSMKEAAYKANQRLVKHPPKFNPKSNLCSFINKSQDLILSDLKYPKKMNGLVQIEYKKFKTHTVIHSDYIHTTACVSGTSIKPISNVTDYGSSQTLFQDYLISQSCPNPEAYSVKKDQNGIPSVYLKNKFTPIITSFSHHGKFGAYLIYAP